MDRQTALSRARALLAKRAAPFGLLPLERVVASDLDLFTAMRDAGASWRTIAAVMAEAGAVRADGTPLSPEQWSAMISRTLRARAAKSRPARPSSISAHSLVATPYARPGRARARMIDVAVDVTGPIADGVGDKDAPRPHAALVPPAEEGRQDSGNTSADAAVADADGIRARMERTRRLRER
jgi:hypothetical protein